jgi:hypothetical protein
MSDVCLEYMYNIICGNNMGIIHIDKRARTKVIFKRLIFNCLLLPKSEHSIMFSVNLLHD